MEPDSKLPSDDNIPSFFSNDDKNIEELSHKKNGIDNSFESTSKKSQGTSNRTVHWPSLGSGAGIAIACIFCGVLLVNLMIYKINQVSLSFGITSVLPSEAHKKRKNTVFAHRIFACQ